MSGCWAPYFILQRFGEADQHCGSIDIDFVLYPRLVDLRVYETIVSMIGKRDYKPYKTKRFFPTDFIAASDLPWMARIIRLKLILSPSPML
ncbi:MAG: hypothetical protein ACE5Z5_09890 [Candidatus Bathyarchaeia archaeon]